MIAALYSGAACLATPALALWLKARLRRGKEDPQRLPERRGVASLPRPAGPLAWIHAASVGESLSVLPLAAVLRKRWPDVTVLFTSGTLTSARLLAERLPAGCIHQFVPLDTPGWIGRFLDHWRPGAILWVESEFWPNTIAAVRRRGIPIALINGRMSQRSFERWRRMSTWVRPPIDAFAPCLAQNAVAAERLAALGARNARTVGNLKFDTAPLPVDETAFAALRAQIASRPAWLAASLHPAEAHAVVTTHQALASRHPNLLTLVVPRHPERGAEIAQSFTAAGLRAGRRSDGAAITSGIDVYIADTLGELGLFYRLAPVAFIGGSLIPHGGQNPLEGARLGAALVLGPSMENFPDMTEALLHENAAAQIADAGGLAGAVGALLADPGLVAGRAQAARRVAESGAGAVERVIAELAPLLDALAPEAARARA